MTTARKFKPLVRHFNQIDDLGDCLQKSSKNARKIREEFHFLSQVPVDLSSYFPKVFNFQEGAVSASYCIEKIPVADSSSFILCNDQLKITDVLLKLFDYLKKLNPIEVSAQNYKASLVTNIYNKNLARLQEIRKLRVIEELNGLCVSYGFNNIDDYCLKINEELNKSFENVTDRNLFYSHGDLCFSNIFINDNGMLLIDPKGYEGDILNTYRPLHYDLAKLSQCLFGKYDFINHELFEIKNNEISYEINFHLSEDVVRTYKMILEYFKINFETVRLIEASLLLSMIPFHKESSKKMLGFLISSLVTFNSVKKSL